MADDHHEDRNIPGYNLGAPEVAKSPITLDELKDLKATCLFTDEDMVYLRLSYDVLKDQAEDLVTRGVRRVVAIFVKKGEVCEWTGKKWSRLDPDATFSDPTLGRPLCVRDLLEAAEADNAVARALLTKGNPVLVEARKASKEEGRTDGHKEGRKEGLQEGIETACELLGIALSPDRRARMNALDAAGLKALLDQVSGLDKENQQRQWERIKFLMTDEFTTTKALGWIDAARMQKDYELVQTYLGMEKPFPVETAFSTKLLDQSIKMDASKVKK